MKTQPKDNGSHPIERAVAVSLTTFYHLELSALRQATDGITSQPFLYWTAIADETRRVLSTLSFALDLHGLEHLDPVTGGEAA